jgi:PAS domain S-box-containing protein
MNDDYLKNLSPQQVGEGFALLAADAKEYAIFLLGQDGHLLYWNLGAERLFGYQSNEIIGQHFSRFFSTEDVLTGQPEHELKTALENGRAEGVRWQVRKDGTRFWCRATLTPLRDEQKQVRSVARVMHDLTDSQAQDAQKKRADDLAEANRSKEEFMALLSHELRNPLSPILNALNILRQMRTNDPIIEQAGNIIDRQVVQMVRLVDDLLDISRIAKGKLRLTKERVEVRVVANHRRNGPPPHGRTQAQLLRGTSDRAGLGGSGPRSAGAGRRQLTQQCGDIHGCRWTHSHECLSRRGRSSDPGAG